MSELTPNPIIRPYRPADRPAVRRISCETAFLEMNRHLILDDDEVLADALTSYFTDFEPESCLVVELDRQVVGYLIGSCSVKRMTRIQGTIVVPRAILKALLRGVFFKAKTWTFLWHCLISFFKGEFLIPDFSQEFPATLHINLDKELRGLGIGRHLIEQYLQYLRSKKVLGIHLGTLSEYSRSFFVQMGFQLLFARRRHYLKSYLGKDVNVYIMGKKL